MGDNHQDWTKVFLYTSPPSSVPTDSVVRTKPLTSIVLTVACLAGLTSKSAAQSADEAWKQDWSVTEGFALHIDSEGYEFPTAIAFVPNPGAGPKDPLYFVTELYGRVRVVTNDRTVHTFAEAFFELSLQEELPDAMGENGMAGICLDSEHGYVFVSFVYHDQDGQLRNNIARFETVPGTFSTAPRGMIAFTDIFAAHPSAQSHQIGPMAIHERHLYVGVGDARAAILSRNIESPMGKILRMTLDGKPVPDNPFYQNDDVKIAANFVWAYGLRNPFSLAFAGSRLFVADNGPGVDRFVEVVRNADYLYDGSDWSIGSRADVVFAPAVSPVQMAFLPSDAKIFPPEYRSRFFLACSGFVGSPPGPGTHGDKSVLMIRYDPVTNQISRPRPFLRYAGRAVQMPVGLAFGPDGLYFCAIFPVRDGRGGVIRVSFDPEGGHPRVLGQDPHQLIASSGCFGCHSLDPKLPMPAPSLDRESMLARLSKQLNSPEYEESLARVDLLDFEPFRSTRNARDEVRNTEGIEQVRTYMASKIRQPKFDNPYSAMADLDIAENEVELIVDFLMPADLQISATDRFKYFLMRLVPHLRYRHLIFFLAGGVGIGLAAAMALLMLVRIVRSRKLPTAMPGG